MDNPTSRRAGAPPRLRLAHRVGTALISVLVVTYTYVGVMGMNEMLMGRE